MKCDIILTTDLIDITVGTVNIQHLTTNCRSYVTVSKIHPDGHYSMDTQEFTSHEYPHSLIFFLHKIYEVYNENR